MRTMKDSGVSWIGSIPESWSVSKVSMFYQVALGKMLQPNSEGNDSLQDYLCAANVGGNKLTFSPIKQMWIKDNERHVYDLHRGDLLVVEGGDVASSAILEHEPNTPLYFQNALHRVRPKNGHIAFLRYWLMAAKGRGYFDLICNKATIAHFTKEKFLALPIVTPNISEQEQIVDYLDCRCATIDALIANQQQQIEKLKQYKQAVITEAVTRGLDPNVQMKDSGVEWIGAVPEHWELHRIAYLYEERKEPGADDLPLLQVSINTGVSDHEMAEDEQDRVFIRMEDKTKYKRVYPGDLTYNMMRAWQGAFGAVRVNGMVSPAYVVAKPRGNASIDTRYFEALLRTHSATEEMHRYSHGIMDFRLRLYWPEFRNIRVCLPPFEEQQRIAAFIDEKSAQIDALIAVKQKKADKLAQYKKSLIYEVVTGKQEV